MTDFLVFPAVAGAIAFGWFLNWLLEFRRESVALKRQEARFAEGWRRAHGR